MPTLAKPAMSEVGHNPKSHFYSAYLEQNNCHRDRNHHGNKSPRAYLRAEAALQGRISHQNPHPPTLKARTFLPQDTVRTSRGARDSRLLPRRHL